MPDIIFFNKKFIRYLIKFISVFALLYFGTLAVIGISAPGGFYSPFIGQYLNYVAGLRYALLHGSKLFLLLLGYKTIITSIYTLKFIDGRGVHIVYSCLGYGVMSFWAAFVFANKDSLYKKLKWIIGGWLIIYIINVTRISLLLLATNKRWQFPFNLNHHTLFTITAYAAIFVLMYFFDKSEKNMPITDR